MHRMYMIAGLIFLLMVGSFGISNDDEMSVQSYGCSINGMGSHAVVKYTNDDLDNLTISGVIDEVDKQTRANGICR